LPRIHLVEKKIHRDPRNYALSLRTHTSTHSDDITALHFLNSDNPLPQNTLLSGSSDGLLCTSNADEDDEDEAVLNVANWGCSISQAGWIYGPSEPRIWAGSDMETFSTWSKQVKREPSLLRYQSVHSLVSLTWKIALKFVYRPFTTIKIPGSQIISSLVKVVPRVMVLLAPSLAQMSLVNNLLHKYPF
jgi:hypothetical protein